jgi:hypothetical protein
MVSRLFDGMLALRTSLPAATLSTALVSGPADAQPSLQRASMAAMGADDVWRFVAQASGDSLPTVVVVFLVVFIVLAVGFLVVLIDAGRSRRRILAAETFLASAFRLDGLRLETVPEQFRELDRRTADLMREFQELQRAPKVQPRSGGSSFVGILTQMQGQAVAELAKLADNAGFKDVNDVLGIQNALAQFESHCAQLGRETNLSRAMLTALESRDTWNAVLTMPAILDAYFENDALRPLIFRLRAIDYVLRAAFLSFDVEIIVFRPFTPVESADATRAKDAPRNLASLPAVRQRAAEAVRAIPERTTIVMDCFAPGWNSNKIGRRAPRFTIYEPNG